MMPRTTTAAPTAMPAIAPVLRPLLEVLPAVEVELAALLLVTVTTGIDDWFAVSSAPQGNSANISYRLRCCFCRQISCLETNLNAVRIHSTVVSRACHCARRATADFGHRPNCCR